MNQAEKREAGERLIKLTDWSDREIARRLAVGKSTINDWRNAPSVRKRTDTIRTVTRGNTTYQMNVSNIGKGNGQGQ
jgi:transposase